MASPSPPLLRLETMLFCLTFTGDIFGLGHDTTRQHSLQKFSHSELSGTSHKAALLHPALLGGSGEGAGDHQAQQKADAVLQGAPLFFISLYLSTASEVARIRRMRMFSKASA